MWPNNPRQHETHQTTTRRIGIDGVCSPNLVGKFVSHFSLVQTVKKGFRRDYFDTLLASGVDIDFGIEAFVCVGVDIVFGFVLV